MILYTVEFIFRGSPQLFPKIIFSRILVLLLHDPKSYSRGVLTDLKVPPSKSMSSQDYFTYLCYGHIFNISKDRPHFVKKFTLLVCYIQIYQVSFSLAVLLFSVLILPKIQSNIHVPTNSITRAQL